jgi:hypothetical protein
MAETYAEAEAASYTGPYRAKLGYWEMRSTQAFPKGSVWSARPLGALAAVITGASDLTELEENISEYMSDLDGHVAEARRALDALPENYTGERALQEALINALAKLARS